MHHQLAAPSVARLARLLGLTAAIARVAAAKLAVAPQRLVFAASAVLHAVQRPRPRRSAQSRRTWIRAGRWRRHDAVSGWHVAFAAVSGVAHVLVAPLRQAKATRAASVQACVCRAIADVGGMHRCASCSIWCVGPPLTASVRPTRGALRLTARPTIAAREALAACRDACHGARE